MWFITQRESADFTSPCTTDPRKSDFKLTGSANSKKKKKKNAIVYSPKITGFISSQCFRRFARRRMPSVRPSYGTFLFLWGWRKLQF